MTTAPSNGTEAIDLSQLDAQPFGTPQQLVELMDGEVAAGRLTREKADAMLRADGVEPPARKAEEALFVPPDEAETTAEVFPAARPEDYRMPRLTQGSEELTQEHIEFDRQARTWLAAAQFPREIGSAVADEVARVDARMQAASDFEFSAFQAQETAQLRRMWGKDYDRKMGLARQLVAEIEAQSPGLVHVLNETGAGSSATVIANFALQAERLQARRRK